MQRSIHTIKQTLTPLFQGILDLVYPPLCLVCEKKLVATEDQLCDACLEGFKLLGKPHANFSVPGEVFIHTAWALFDFDPPFQQLIHHLKYSRRRKPILRVLNYFGREILDQLQGQAYDWIVSIPLHPRKRRERGYNQVDGVSEWLAENLHTQLGNQLVVCHKYTQSQTQLNAEERQENVSEAFGVKHETEIVGKRLLLVDDVLTTGATANALANILIATGASRVDLLTLSTPSKGKP